MCKSSQRPRKLNVNTMWSDTIRSELETNMNEKLPALAGSVEENNGPHSSQRCMRCTKRSWNMWRDNMQTGLRRAIKNCVNR